ncbi:hypothetical protein E9232_000538 [Inquilinus ginsengisoli]|uniref:Uncharacterized protein n=1 Tax=Inquilinus ginsengisoli TaxID=363840 RepID=A0ABU1JHE7_9PROT|nr:hypothetical protein [Inquilinus ginsengisoli]MDR6288039.1 hypothetical protein [Inquilinus ginsengisoli]
MVKTQLTGTDDQGGAVAIPKGDIVFIRESYRSGEIPDRTKVDYGTAATEQEVYLVDSLTAVLKQLGAGLATAKLTTPCGTVVHVAAARVETVRAPQSWHHPKARTILLARGREIQVREDRDLALRRINAARPDRAKPVA